MPLYTCKMCNYSSKIKTQYNRHLNTKKHMRNLNNNGNIISNSNVCLQIPPDTVNKYICEYCDMEFSRKDNLTRHQDRRCKKKDHSDYKELFYQMKSEFESEKKELRKNIELLLNKVGNTTINNTQNIQLNSYGSEDLSHITDQLKTQLLKGPFSMIPKLIKEVHFNDDKPENKNILLTNKNDNKVKVFSGNKWIYQNKNETIDKLVDGKYFILDNHFDSVIGSLDDKNKNIYDNFRCMIDGGDRKLIERLKQECELVLLNNR